MTPTTSTQGPESDDGRQDAPAATDAATEAREAIDLDGIEKRAKAATPGPWRLSEMNPGEVWAVRDPADWDALLVATTATRLNPADADNTLHIAGMDPEQTLALVAEVRELRAKVAEVRVDREEPAWTDEQVIAAGTPLDEGDVPGPAGARDVDLDGIEARAKAATPGPWEARGEDYPWVALYDDEAKIPEHESLPSFDSGGTATAADAEHIAGMDPEQTLALVAEVRELRAKVARVEAVGDTWRGYGHGLYNIHQSKNLPCSVCDLLSDLDTGLVGWAEKSDREVARANCAEAERDDLRARLAKVEADLIVSEADRDRYKDAFLRANEACTVREAAILDLQAERDSAEAHASVACEAETRLAKVEAARSALGTVRRTAPRTLYDQGYQDGQTDERAVIVAALDAALRGDR